MAANFERYRGKKVFVTGHTGFKGGWLVAILNHFGAEIKGYALSPENNYGIYSVIDGDSMCSSTIENIKNKECLEKEILDFEPDFIFHLAAQPLVRASYLNPSETFDVNVMGTSYLLEAIRKLKNHCTVIIITTDKVYQNNEDGIPFVETDKLGGHDPYSTSKACAELLVESFNKSYFINQVAPIIKIATVRAGNVIGGGDFSQDRIIPDIIRKLSINEEVIVRNPTSIRPWQHVLEPLFGYLILALYLEETSHNEVNAFNFGPNSTDHLTVKELVDLAIKNWGSGSFKIDQQVGVHEAGILRLNIDKVKKEIGWEPKLNAYKAIQFTIDWYKSSDPGLITKRQILEYLNLLN